MRYKEKTTFERRIELLFYLVKKQGKKVSYIANEFDVCRMTIYRDIDFLSRYAPLYIKQGGVHISDEYKPEILIQLSKEEEMLMRKLLDNEYKRFVFGLENFLKKEPIKERFRF